MTGVRYVLATWSWASNKSICNGKSVDNVRSMPISPTPTKPRWVIAWSIAAANVLIIGSIDAALSVRG